MPHPQNIYSVLDLLKGKKRITNLVDVVRNIILMEQVNSSEKGTAMKGEAHIMVRLRFKQYH